MRAVFAYAAVMALLVGAAAAQQSAVKKYPLDGFEVAFTGPVKTTDVEVYPENRREVLRGKQHDQAGSTVDGGQRLYTVAANRNRSEIDFDRASTSAIAALRCTTPVKDAPLTHPNGRARVYHGTGCKGEYDTIARYYVVGRRFFQVVAIYATKGGDAAAAERFLDSFKITVRD